MHEPTVVVGKVIKTHGVGGELSVLNRSDNPDRWSPGSVVFTEDGRNLTIKTSRPHSGRLLLAFEEVTDRGAADTLRGTLLVVPESWLPELPDGQWWPHQLEGCRVVTEEGRDLGVVSEVIPNPANDLWVAVNEDGSETFVPALRDLLIDVNVADKRILVKDVPGLTAPTEGE